MTRAKDISKILTDADISGNIDVDGVTNLDVVDIDGAVDMASTLQVDGAITSSDGMIITTADNTTQVTLKSTDADGNSGPELDYYRLSASPADNDYLGRTKYIGRNDNTQDVTAVDILARMIDVSDGEEDATYNIRVMKAGSLVDRITLNGGETILNEDSVDLNFRVESNGNANMLFVDGGTDEIYVAKNASDVAVVGHEFRATGFLASTRDGATVSALTRLSSDGTILEFRKDSSAIGGISVIGGKLTINSQGSNLSFAVGGTVQLNTDDTQFYPQADDTHSLGISSNRFDNIFATNNSINTSDRNEKQDIEELTDAEKRVAVACKSLMRKYRWKSAVTSKGDDARTHFGIIAQDLQDAFTAESLDASDYAMFCSDTWWEKEISVDAIQADEANDIEAQDAYTYMDTKQETTTGYTKKTRLGVRYSELLAFIISAI